MGKGDESIGHGNRLALMIVIPQDNSQQETSPKSNLTWIHDFVSFSRLKRKDG